MATKDNLPDNSNDLLYVKKVENNQDLYCGYRREYLAQNLTEMEEGFIVCKKCTGVMREAFLSLNEGETTCLVCSSNENMISSIKAVQNSISKLQIKCPVLKDCDWKGYLSEAEEHLEICSVFLIECNQCNQVLSRGENNNHTNKLCPSRIVGCRFCFKEGKAKDLEEHFTFCSEYPISCPNNCGEEFTRRVLRDHKSKCELEKIRCPYTEYGCIAESMLRRDLLAHKKELYIEHQDMSLTRIKQLENKQTEMEWEAKTMKQLDGVEWEIKNIDKLIDQQVIEGPDFYVNKYKLNIFCYYNNDPFGTLLLMSLKRIRGEFDGNLGSASISHFRLIIANKLNYKESYYTDGNMNYQLKIGTDSESIGFLPCFVYRKHITADNSLFVRFYFDVNTANHMTRLSNEVYLSPQNPLTSTKESENDPFTFYLDIRFN